MQGIALLACLAAASSPALDWWRDDVFYEIYPRSFADSDGDGTGDLRGVTKHLDDLKALGVDDLWLTPIHPSPSEHGYDVTDYEDVAKDLGGLQAFDEMVAKAHARGMHVVLDFVLNHTSVEHPWFKKNPDFYVWRDKPDARWRRPWDNADVWHKNEKDGRYYLALFWSGMPDLNLQNDDVVSAMVSAMRFWRARGVDGFRIDAARYLVEVDDGKEVHMADTAATHALLQRIHHEIGDDVLVVAEVWTDDAVIAGYQKDVQLAFSFGTAKGIVEAVRDEERAPLVEALQAAEQTLGDRSIEAPFLTNHDMTRVMRELHGDVARAKLAAATLLSMPGTPFLYYGEEIGMTGKDPRAAHDDASQRTKLAWSDVEAERTDPTSLWRTYQSLLKLRHEHPALTRGAAVRPPTVGGGRGAFALLRDGHGERVLFLANFAKDPAGAFDVELSVPAAAVQVVAGDAAVTVRGGGVHVDALAAHGYAFVVVR